MIEPSDLNQIFTVQYILLFFLLKTLFNIVEDGF